MCVGLCADACVLDLDKSMGNLVAPLDILWFADSTSCFVSSFFFYPLTLRSEPCIFFINLICVYPFYQFPCGCFKLINIIIIIIIFFHPSTVFLTCTVSIISLFLSLLFWEENKVKMKNWFTVRCFCSFSLPSTVFVILVSSRCLMVFTSSSFG